MTDCVCEQPQAGEILCRRHDCLKAGHFVQLCRTRPDYRRLWDEGRGPGQAAPPARLPVGGHVWEGGIALARVVAGETFAEGLSALDIGTGTGIVGIAAARAGLKVTLGDVCEWSLANARENAIRDGFELETLRVDWREPCDRTWDVILGGDVLWSASLNESLVDWTLSHWTRRGPCLFSDATGDVSFPAILASRGVCFKATGDGRGSIYRLTASA